MEVSVYICHLILKTQVLLSEVSLISKSRRTQKMEKRMVFKRYLLVTLCQFLYLLSFKRNTSLFSSIISNPAVFIIFYPFTFCLQNQVPYAQQITYLLFDEISEGINYKNVLESPVLPNMQLATGRKKKKKRKCRGHNLG